jgi:hypothetical protein
MNSSDDHETAVAEPKLRQNPPTREPADNRTTENRTPDKRNPRKSLTPGTGG